MGVMQGFFTFWVLNDVEERVVLQVCTMAGRSDAVLSLVERSLHAVILLQLI